MNVLGVMSANGWVHWEIERNKVDKERFMQFIQAALPKLTSAGIRYFVMDNASVHSVLGLDGLLKDHGIMLVPLPVYSPMLNPIELAWKEYKEQLVRTHCGMHMVQSMELALGAVDKAHFSRFMYHSLYGTV
eukprot:TRINITY_DN3269_c0_g1_i1.p1 TRINITY_DN3269_c0_g1~~TRINITY_DN3269_c0_g1_i1.p1  ORF type:complete len:132 (-),score=31.59 TRINITY_DN3269_c0_g1_i1:6-401(-)